MLGYPDPENPQYFDFLLYKQLFLSFSIKYAEQEGNFLKTSLIGWKDGKPLRNVDGLDPDPFF